MPKLRLTLAKPSPEGIALLVERLTGRKPSPEKLEQIRVALAAKLAARSTRTE